jgi:hypothetical protein
VQIDHGVFPRIGSEPAFTPHARSVNVPASDAIDGGAPQHFVDGLRPAVWVGAGLVGVGALAALAIPGRRRQEAPQPAFDAAR